MYLYQWIEIKFVTEMLAERILSVDTLPHKEKQNVSINICLFIRVHNLNGF